METVTMDFQFPVMDKIYGTFLVTLYGHFEDAEDAEVKDVRHLYPLTFEKNNIHLSVEVPKDIAMLLKLQFGGNMRTRPIPEPFPGLSKYKLNKFKEIKILDEYKYDNQYFIKNYIDDLIKNEDKDISDYHLT